MGIIVDKVQEIFDDFKENSESGMDIKIAIKDLVKGLVEIADKSVQYQHHRDILDVEIEKQFEAL